MTNEIKVYEPDVSFVPAQISFNNFDEMQERALEIAGFVGSTVVTEDTVKANKKMIAETRKITKTLDTARIQLKKDILKNFSLFEKQVKEINTILDSADRIVRKQVKELEEKERDEKEEKLKELWKKRAGQYDLSSIPNLFEKWLTPQHLNKSMSITKCEKDMTEFLELTQKNVETIAAMPDKEELMSYFSESLDLRDAIVQVRQDRVRKENARKILDQVDEEAEEKAIFVVIGAKDVRLTEMLLKDNKINFERK